MILADTSVWIDHLRLGDRLMSELLVRGDICCHPYIVGELALGTLRNRTAVLRLLDQLPWPVVARADEVRHLIEGRRLHGLGIGYVDVHLLASCQLTAGCRLWTRDRRLGNAAEMLEVRAPLDLPH